MVCGRPGKVLVAMSGGVDSAVAALLLVRAGYEVAGFTAELINQETSEFGGSKLNGILIHESAGSISENARDAGRICGMLGIRHFIIDMHGRFHNEVIEPFVCAYLSGKTPNPCIYCNNKIKFSAFFDVVDELEYDFLATGHYARIEYSEEEKEYRLLRAGTDKDQSYVLYGMSQRELARTIFPLGDFSKSDIRSFADEAGFSLSDRPESQDICFIPRNDYARFIEDATGVATGDGDFVDRNGRVLGKHKGFFRYTVGQRKGIGIAAEKPYFVAAIDAKKNRVVLGGEEELFSNRLIADHLCFVSDRPVSYPFSAEAQIRYAAQTVSVTVFERDDGAVEVRFDEPVRAVTPGQTIVFYRGEKVLGGGEIVRALSVIIENNRHDLSEYFPEVKDVDSKSDDMLRPGRTSS